MSSLYQHKIKQIALLETCELVKKSHTINSQFLHPVDSFQQCRSLTFWNTKFRLAPTCKNRNKHLNQPFITETCVWGSRSTHCDSAKLPKSLLTHDSQSRLLRTHTRPITQLQLCQNSADGYEWIATNLQYSNTQY